jgi:hypothetical protein
MRKKLKKLYSKEEMLGHFCRTPPCRLIKKNKSIYKRESTLRIAFCKMQCYNQIVNSNKY